MNAVCKPILGSYENTQKYHLAPFAYPWAWDMYKNCLANHWIPDEISIADDVADYRSDLDPKYRHLFLSVMAQLTTFDIERGDDAAETLLRIVQPAEMRQFLKRLVFEEALHTQSYRYCIENMGIPESGPDNLYDVWSKVPSMKARVEMSQKISDELIHLYQTEPNSLKFKQHFLRTNLFWFLIFEGVWFMMNLSGPIQQLARLGKFKNTAEQFIYIARDETQHIKFGVELIKEFMLQHPETLTEEIFTTINEDISKAIDLEGQFMSYCLKDGPIIGYSVPDHVETSKYFVNMRMRSIGFPEIYPGANHKFPWMAEQMELKKEKNFFETRVTEYRSGGLKWD